MNLMFWPLALAGLGFALYAGPAILTRLVWKDGGHTLRRANHVDAAFASGKSYQDIMDEDLCRALFAKIRRKSSDAVMADPVNWQSIIKDHIDAELDELKGEPRIASMLGGMFAGLSYGHILYEDAARLVDSLTVQRRPVKPSMDRYASLRMLNPY